MVMSPADRAAKMVAENRYLTGSAELAALQIDPQDVLADAERASAAVQSFTSHAIRALLGV